MDSGDPPPLRKAACRHSGKAECTLRPAEPPRLAACPWAEDPPPRTQRLPVLLGPVRSAPRARPGLGAGLWAGRSRDLRWVIRMASVTGQHGLGQEIDGQAAAPACLFCWEIRARGQQQAAPAPAPRHHGVRTRQAHLGRCRAWLIKDSAAGSRRRMCQPRWEALLSSPSPQREREAASLCPRSRGRSLVGAQPPASRARAPSPPQVSEERRRAWRLLRGYPWGLRDEGCPGSSSPILITHPLG